MIQQVVLGCDKLLISCDRATWGRQDCRPHPPRVVVRVNGSLQTGRSSRSEVPVCKDRFNRFV